MVLRLERDRGGGDRLAVHHHVGLQRGRHGAYSAGRVVVFASGAEALRPRERTTCQGRQM